MQKPNLSSKFRVGGAIVSFLTTDNTISLASKQAIFTLKDAEKLWTNFSKAANVVPGARKELKQWRKT